MLEERDVERLFFWRVSHLNESEVEFVDEQFLCFESVWVRSNLDDESDHKVFDSISLIFRKNFPLEFYQLFQNSQSKEFGV